MDEDAFSVDECCWRFGSVDGEHGWWIKGCG